MSDLLFFRLIKILVTQLVAKARIGRVKVVRPQSRSPASRLAKDCSAKSHSTACMLGWSTTEPITIGEPRKRSSFGRET